MRAVLRADAGRLAVLLLLILDASPAPAARPFVTDDARVVDRQSCQVETWSQLGTEGDEYWMIPSCNLFYDVEIAAGFALLPRDAHSGPRDPLVQVQGKKLLRTLNEGALAWGIAGGTTIDAADPGQGERLASVYGYLPATFAVDGQRALVHLNAGARYESADDILSAIWGVGTEVELHPRVFAIGEVYGNHRDHPFAQLGLRVWLVPSSVQLDGAGGVAVGNADEHWVTVGLRLLSPALW